MDTTTAWSIGWNAMFAYVCGRQDAGDKEANFDRAANFADRYARYWAENVHLNKRFQCWDAYKSYVIMETMGQTEEITPQLEKCETTND